MGRTAILYVRSVAGNAGTVGEQIADLRDVARRHGWTVIAEYSDHADLDAKRRPGFEALSRRLVCDDVDFVVVPSLQHVGGPLDNVAQFATDLHATGVALYLNAEGIDTSTASGTAWLAALTMLDRHRKEIRAERARIGQQRAKMAGVKFGRPLISESKLVAVRLSLKSGAGIRPTSRSTGVSPAKVLLIQREMADHHVPAERATP